MPEGGEAFPGAKMAHGVVCKSVKGFSNVFDVRYNEAIVYEPEVIQFLDVFHACRSAG